jgi:hypothetical protein
VYHCGDSDRAAPEEELWVPFPVLKQTRATKADPCHKTPPGQLPQKWLVANASPEEPDPENENEESDSEDPEYGNDRDGYQASDGSRGHAGSDDEGGAERVVHTLRPSSAVHQIGYYFRRELAVMAPGSSGLVPITRLDGAYCTGV